MDTTVENKNKGVDGEYLTFIEPAHWSSQIDKSFNGKLGRLSGFNTNFGFSLYGNQNRYRADTETATKGYTLFNAGLSFNIDVNTKSALNIFIRANNLFNTAWQSNMGRLKYFEDYQQSPKGHGIYGMGRNITMKVTWQF